MNIHGKLFFRQYLVIFEFQDCLYDWFWVLLLIFFLLILYDDFSFRKGVIPSLLTGIDLLGYFRSSEPQISQFFKLNSSNFLFVYVIPQPLHR